MMRLTSPFSHLPFLQVKRFHGRLLCRISLRPSLVDVTLPDREFVIVAARTSPHLRHLIVYRQPVPDDPPRAA